MIEEIKNPLPPIQYFLDIKKQEIVSNNEKVIKEEIVEPVLPVKRKKETAKQKREREKKELTYQRVQRMKIANIEHRKRRILKEAEYLYDVSLNSDPSIVEDFAEQQQISYELAETLLIGFFEELKAQLLDGKVIYIENIGKFYVAAPCRNEKGEFSMPCRYIPRLQMFRNSRLYDYEKKEKKSQKKT